VAIPARLRKKVREKIRIDFSSIVDKLTVNQVGRGRFLNLQVSEIKRKANEAQMREEFTKLPSGVANLFALYSSLDEKIESTYMPNWGLLGMTVVKGKVRKKKLRSYKQELNKNQMKL